MSLLLLPFESAAKLVQGYAVAPGQDTDKIAPLRTMGVLTNLRSKSSAASIVTEFPSIADVWSLGTTTNSEQSSETRATFSETGATNSTGLPDPMTTSIAGASTNTPLT